MRRHHSAAVVVVQNTTHVATAALGGLLVGRLVGLDGPDQLAFAAVASGYGSVPDLDHESSTPTRILGPVTGVLSWMLRGASGWLYARTKGPNDEDWKGTHRHLTHTVLFAVALGGLCTLTTALWGPWALLTWIAFGLLLAVDRLGKAPLIAFGIGTARWVPAAWNSDVPFGRALLNGLDDACGWAGLAVVVGCVVHCLGDAVTKMGCPLLFPVMIGGERWAELPLPECLTFVTGSRTETHRVYPTTLVLIVIFIPGVIPLLGKIYDIATSPETAAAVLQFAGF